MKRTIATDIAEIAQRLDGVVNFESIKYSQIILENYKDKGVNDLFFIGKKYGLYFYTSRSAIDGICFLEKQKMPTYVATESTCNIYEIE